MPKKSIDQLRWEAAKLRNEALDLAADLARDGNAQAGVDAVLTLIRVASDSTELGHIMSAACSRGFNCQFYPVNGQTGVRVEWRNK